MSTSAVEHEGKTLEQLLEGYLKERLVRPATEQTYQRVVSLWIKDTRINALEAIEQEQVLQWRKAILGRARAQTWNKYRRHLSALFNHAMERGWAESNPFKAVSPARPDRKRKKTVDNEVLIGARRLLQEEMARGCEKDERLRPAWFWAIVIEALRVTGVRRHQIVALRWGDVDLVSGAWNIRAETFKTYREWVLPVPPAVVQDLKTLLDRTTAKLGREPTPADQVYNVTLFYRRYKGPEMTDEQVSGFFGRLSEQLGQRISPHRLRHSMATHLARYGDYKTLQEILGHTSIITTMGYVHPDVERMRTLMCQLPPL